MPRLWRLTPVIAMATVVAFLAAGIGMATYVDRTNAGQRFAQTAVQAQTLAATVSAALTFNDHQAAEEYVDALQVNPDIQLAGVYDVQGRLFAGWTRGGALAPDLRDAPSEAKAGQLLVTAVVEQGGAPLGTVYLQSVTEPLAQRLQRYGVIALLISMAVVVICVLGVAQGALRRANAELAEANESLRNEIIQREQVQEALRQAQKMEAIGQLTGGVAHDFNNLLQIIKGNLERMQRYKGGAEVSERFARMIDSAMRGADRAAVLTQRLLAFSRRQPLAPTLIDVNQLVAEMSELFVRTLGEAIELESVRTAGLWRTQADTNQLENALLNLAVNARDAMPDGGKMTIETANAFLDEAYAQRQRPEEIRPGQYVMIAVTDTGTGMSQEVQAKVFEPFFTTKDIGQGTGLGLSQVYGFVRQSGGHVRIYSELGQGTTVRLYLPRSLADAAAGAVATEDRAVPAGRPGDTVLVVEDQDDVREFSIETLRELGYNVIEAADGHVALGYLRSRGDITLLFTDVGLPGGLNGRQLADAARQVAPSLRVLFTTGYARNAIVHHGRLDPGVDLLVKPFTQAELAQKIRHVLDQDRAGG